MTIVITSYHYHRLPLFLQLLKNTGHLFVKTKKKKKSSRAYFIMFRNRPCNKLCDYTVG